MESAIVTGATGFIGSNLVRRLVSEGYKVAAIIRPSASLEILEDLKNKIDYCIYDGTVKSMLEAFSKFRPNIVFHLAALFVAEHKSEDIDGLLESNLLFGTHILEAAAKCNIKYFINAGTHWQNYKGERYNPVNLYAATKEAFEVLARYFIETTEMRMLSIKLFDTYGPNDKRKKILSLLKRISETGEVLDMSDGEQEMGFVYIDDVIKGFIKAIKLVKEMRKHTRKVYILAPEKIFTLREVASIFSQVSGRTLNINWGKRPYRKREMMKINKNWLNILDNIETLSLSEGVKRMLEIEGERLENV